MRNFDYPTTVTLKAQSFFLALFNHIDYNDRVYLFIEHYLRITNFNATERFKLFKIL